MIMIWALNFAIFLILGSMVVYFVKTHPPKPNEKTVFVSGKIVSYSMFPSTFGMCEVEFTFKYTQIDSFLEVEYCVKNIKKFQTDNPGILLNNARISVEVNVSNPKKSILLINEEYYNDKILWPFQSKGS